MVLQLGFVISDDALRSDSGACHSPCMGKEDYMRMIVTPGEKISKYICPFCGQVEVLTDGENAICQNCGSEMVVFDETIAPVEEEAQVQIEGIDQPVEGPEVERIL